MERPALLGNRNAIGVFQTRSRLMLTTRNDDSLQNLLSIGRVTNLFECASNIRANQQLALASARKTHTIAPSVL